MQLKRKNPFYNLSCAAVSVFMYLYHNIEFSGAENIPKKGPALLLSKHQSIQDILLEGTFLQNNCGRQGNWVMKSGLPLFFDYLGGIKVKRSQDVKKYIRKNKIKGMERRRLFEETREYNQDAMDYVGRLYRRGEIVVVHPEGTRSEKGRMKPLEEELVVPLLNFTKEIQEKYGIKIPVILAGIEYSSIWRPRSKVYLRAGKPLDITQPNIVQIIEQEIRKLSNLSEDALP